MTQKKTISESESTRRDSDLDNEEIVQQSIKKIISEFREAAESLKSEVVSTQIKRARFEIEMTVGDNLETISKNLSSSLKRAFPNSEISPLREDRWYGPRMDVDLGILYGDIYFEPDDDVVNVRADLSVSWEFGGPK